MTDEIAITYDTLFDILRKEKNEPGLQDLPENFWMLVLEYIKEKDAFLERKRNDHGLFGHEEKKKAEQEMDNIRRLVGDIYNRREKKILDLARDVSRSRGQVIHSFALLPEEEQMYHAALAEFNRYREGILYRLLSGKLPEVATPQHLKTSESKQQKETVTIRFREAMPQFMGPNMVKYGPFSIDEEIELPSVVASLLIKKGVGELLL